MKITKSGLLKAVLIFFAIPLIIPVGVLAMAFMWPTIIIIFLICLDDELFMSTNSAILTLGAFGVSIPWWIFLVLVLR